MGYRGVACGDFDVDITDAAFLADIGDGYTNQTADHAIAVSDVSPPFSLHATHYRWKVAYSPTPVPDTSLAATCEQLAGYSYAVPITTPLDLDTSSHADAYVILCVVGQAPDLLGGSPYHLGWAKGYTWLRDTRPPAAFTVSQGTQGPGVVLNWTDPQTPPDLPNSPLHYQVRVATDAAGNNIVFQQDVSGARTTSINSLNPGIHYAFVTAFDLAGNAARLADNSPLTVGNTPGSFGITGPANPITTENFVVIWSPSAGADSYQFVLSGFPDCSNPALTETIQGTSRAFTGFGQGDAYVCVTAVNSFGSTSASNDPYLLHSEFAVLSKTLFVTSSTYYVTSNTSYPPPAGLFGTSEAADYLCTQAAYQAGLISSWDGYYRAYQALLTNSFVDLPDGTGFGGGSILNVNGNAIANDYDQLLSGNFFAPILTETAQTISGSYVPVFTGSNPDGTWSGETCGDWGNPNASAATVGNLNASGTGWVSHSTRACFLPSRLYCLGYRDHQVTFGSGANQFSLLFSPVGNPGNAPDLTGIPASAGSVAYDFNMGKYEVSRDMVAKANAAGGLGITLADLTSYGGNDPNRPATGVTWNEAARFVNWLNTSQGFLPAYKFTTQPGGAGYNANENISLWTAADAGYNSSNPFRNSQARYFLPSIDEWYKASFYDPAANAGTGGYWNYPTGSDTAPDPVASGTQASTAVFAQPVSQGPAPITLAGGLGPYGVVGLAGNAHEWLESEVDLVNDLSSPDRVNRGNYWGDPNVNMGPSNSSGPPTIEHIGIGFRVAVWNIPLS